ncbi:uncharacterized protein [Argopecten irradians]|uniref:uncharacterized protein n=1 Tax=Argopecten irradians TaxID=31199 RepID=UPI0037160FBD
MGVPVTSLLCLVAVFGACQARDYRQFLRGLRDEIRQELDEDYISELAAVVGLDDSLYDKHCSCEGNSCSCCREFHKMHVCVNASLDSMGADVSLTINGQRIISLKVTGENPPEVCKNYGRFDACVVVNKVKIERQTFSACVNLQIGRKPFLQNIPLGCFKLPPSQNSLSGGNQVKFFV